MKSALSIGLINFVLYLFLVINYRSVAQGRYIESIISDMIIAGLGFSVVKKISEAKSISDRIAYIIGGGLASFCGIYITKMFFGQ
jgi:hypothetical protein